LDVAVPDEQWLGFGECYLPRTASGVGWLLDPESPRLVEIVAECRTRSATSPVDPAALLLDLRDLSDLIRQRHFGVATGRVAFDEPRRLVGEWQARVARDLPQTWGEAIGDVEQRLSLALADNHFRISGAEGMQLRVAEIARPEPGPAVEIGADSGVLVIRIRRLMGDPADERALAQWVAGAEGHFTHDRMIVDVRGNPGGNDGHTWAWAEPYFSKAAPSWCLDQGWVVGHASMGQWNPSVWWALDRGWDAVPPALIAARHNPEPADRLSLSEPDLTGLVPGPEPWRGRMLIVSDAATGSSGESSAWLLRKGFQSVSVGSPTKGGIEYGNIVRYPLPASGLVVSLPTKHNDFGRRVEHVGFPVDRPCDVDIAVEDLVRSFDDLMPR
jgi:hypothetical protein